MKKEEKRMLGYYVAPATQQIDSGTSYLLFSMLEHLVSDGLHLMIFFRITCIHTAILYLENVTTECNVSGTGLTPGPAPNMISSYT